MEARMRLLVALTAVAFISSSAVAEKPIKVRIITADERKACEYLGLVAIGSAWAWHSSKGAIQGALRKVEKIGGDSLFMIGQGQSGWTGATVTGEAYRCAKASS